MKYPDLAVDRLGFLEAQIATLSAERDSLRKLIIADGVGAHIGKLFRATVSIFDRATIPNEVMKDKLETLGVPRRWFRDHTRITSVTTVRCVARHASEAEVVERIIAAVEAA